MIKKKKRENKRNGYFNLFMRSPFSTIFFFCSFMINECITKTLEHTSQVKIIFYVV